MSEFGDTEFAVGSVVGYRRWQVTADGELRPVTFYSRGPWVNGENIAECHGSPKAEVTAPAGEDWRKRGQIVDEWRGNHEMVDCAHGFYAYFRGGSRDNSYGAAPTIGGIIEGYGEVLIGTKGFRAMKAKIIALSIEPHMGAWRLEPQIVIKLTKLYPNIPIFGSTEIMQGEYLAKNGADEWSKLTW